MNSDAGVKQAVPKAQLHKHQDAGEGDASQGDSQAHGLASQQQPGKGNAAALPDTAKH